MRVRKYSCRVEMFSLQIGLLVQAWLKHTPVSLDRSSNESVK